MKRLLFALSLLWPLPLAAQQEAAIVREAVEVQILPGYRTLAGEAAALDAVAARDCTPTSANLRKAYNKAFDAWMGVAHLRFGPSEEDNRAFALAFWPDSRGATVKTLAGMIADEDAIVDDKNGYKAVSVAARGFFALEMMLYEESFSARNPDYACKLTRAIAHDLALTAADLSKAWDPAYAEIITTPGPENPIYFNEMEAVQELYSAVLSGLEFTSDQRLGRPIGSIERPRPKRAEAWRSGRSLRNVTLSIEATGTLARTLASNLPEEDRMQIGAAIASALEEADELDDPVFANVTDPTGRLRVEVLQQSVQSLRDTVRTVIGPALGVSEGFNSMDGD
ncbi:imelysin family protein [Amaricoccus macauensis]|uniref:imelysin family protein n=1 Tax=Amaricoccus macauensis TaxID=57001 RepID=UPI003C7D89EF